MKNPVSDAEAPNNIPPCDPIKSGENIDRQYSTYRAFQKPKRKCEQCGQLFIAKTIVSRFCSTKCTNRSNYLKNKLELNTRHKILIRKKDKLIPPKIKLAEAIPPKGKDLLSVMEFATRLGVCKQTVYNMQKRGQVRLYSFSNRLSFISWPEFEAMTLGRMPNQSTKSIPERTQSKFNNPKVLRMQTGTNSQTREIKPSIPSSRKSKCTPNSVQPSMPVPNDSPEWITSDMACERYSIATKGNFYAFVNKSKNRVPKKREYGTLLYSLAVMDKLRGYNISIPLGYISSVEAQNRYQVNETALYAVLYKNKITRIKKGREIYFPETEIQKRYRPRVAI